MNPDPKRRPGATNVLLIHSDQHRFDCIGANQPHVAAGPGRLMRTPNLDRLAREGTNFTHAFTPNPVCSPARACLQTGAWATTHKCITIPGTEAFQPADARLPVLTQLLDQAGYIVGHVGKFHDELEGRPTDHGARDHVDTHHYAAWREAQGLPPQQRTQGWTGEVDPAITAEQSPLAWQADRVLELMDAYAAEGPFFLRWDPPEPHLPNIIPHDIVDWDL